MYARLFNCAAASLPWKLLRTYLKSCASIVQAVVCRPLLLPLLLSRPSLSSDAVRSRNPSKSTLAQDVVAAAVSHKLHSIIRVGAGLIQFVYGSHSRLATGVTSSRILFLPFFCTSFRGNRDAGTRLIGRNKGTGAYASCQRISLAGTRLIGESRGTGAYASCIL